MLLLNDTRELPPVCSSKWKPNVNFRMLEAFKVLLETCTQHAYFLWLLCDAVRQTEAKDVNESNFLWTVFTVLVYLLLLVWNFTFDLLSLRVES